VGGSEHFRNIDRHDVQTCKRILAIRIDESLYFANTRYVESFVLRHVSQQHEIKDVVLICAAINFIDANALETLENMAHYLQNEGVTLHLSEVKGPIMDQLNRVRFQEQLGGGQIFFTTDQAIKALETQD
jgi:SulP family sulfate permease